MRIFLVALLACGCLLGQLAQQLDRTPALASPHAQAYLQRIGDRLVANLPQARLRFHFAAVADDPLAFNRDEPIALPGGYVFLTERLILRAKTEADLAALLAHALAHMTGPHTASNATVPVVLIGSRQSEADAAPRAAAILAGLSFDADSRELAAVQAELRGLKPAPRPPSLLRGKQ